MTGLGRRRDDLGVVAVGEYRTPPPGARPALADRRVEVLGRRDLEALHPGRERALVVGFDEQMQVVALDAQVHDPEVLTPRRGQRRLANCLVRRSAAQVADRRHDAQHHMHGMPRA